MRVEEDVERERKSFSRSLYQPEELKKNLSEWKGQFRSTQQRAKKSSPSLRVQPAPTSQCLSFHTSRSSPVTSITSSVQLDQVQLLIYFLLLFRFRLPAIRVFVFSFFRFGKDINNPAQPPILSKLPSTNHPPFNLGNFCKLCRLLFCLHYCTM